MRSAVVNDQISVDKQQGPVIRIQTERVIPIGRHTQGARDVRAEFECIKGMPVITRVSGERDACSLERSDQVRVRGATTVGGETAVNVDIDAVVLGRQFTDRARQGPFRNHAAG